MLRRPRRNRKTESIRAAIRETTLTPANLVSPLFLMEGENKSEVITSLPVASRMTLDFMLKEIESSMEVGIDKFMIFPAVPDSYKDKTATYSYADDNFYLLAAQTIKKEIPEVTLISDVAMDPYSTDGHDGLVVDGKILNDQTLPILAKMAVAQAQAGFDIIGPSDMMDGRVESIRTSMDEAGYYETSIMSYTAKYASGFYGPFRDALGSAPKGGDKKTYQMDPANKREALIEAELDTIEGADFLMVKPALNYLDVIHMLNEEFELPIAAYHVSGECAMLLAACEKGWLDYDVVMPETLMSIKRAGADVIMTYLAKSFGEFYYR
jgi:porphobilinogen synthase